MTAIQYLQTYNRLERRYIAITEQIKSIENEIISLKSPGFDERVQNSPKNDPIGEMVCNLEKEKGKLGIRMMECKTNMSIIKSQIMQMENINNDYYITLLFRYVLMKDWRFICDTLHLSRTQANKVHGLALETFNDKFGDIYAER